MDGVFERTYGQAGGLVDDGGWEARGGFGGEAGCACGGRAGFAVEESGGVGRGEWGRGDGDGALGEIGREVPVVEVGEELLLCDGDGLGVDGGDSGGGIGLMDGAFSLGGEEGAVAL